MQTTTQRRHQYLPNGYQPHRSASSSYHPDPPTLHLQAPHILGLHCRRQLWWQPAQLVWGS